MTNGPKLNGFDERRAASDGRGCLPLSAEARGELCDMIGLLLEEQLDDNGRDRLLNVLDGNEEALSIYIGEMNRHAGLAWEWGLFADERETSEIGADEVELAFEPVDNAIPIIDLSPLPSPLPPPFVGGPVFSYMVATVILCVMLLSAWAHKITHSDGDFVNTTMPSVAPRGEMEFVGRITGMADCEWADPDTRPYAGSYVPLGRKYELTSGLLEITYTSGARVILEGPCNYEVNSDASGRLQLGKLVARVEKNDELGMMNDESHVRDSDIHHSSFITHHLFSVTTPTAVVTDLGTEFGVEVDEAGSTTSHVFRGSISVRPISGVQGEEGVILGKNESARVEIRNGGISISRRTDAKAEGFVRNMSKINPVVNQDAYAKMVLALNPVIYYRMERPNDHEDRRIADSAPGGHHGELRWGNDFGCPYLSGRYGDALWFRGRDVGDGAIVTDYPKITDDKLTLSAWVMAQGFASGWPSIASNWGDKKLTGQFVFGLFQQEGDLAVAVTQRNGESTTVREGEPLPLHDWQHVAFVLDRSELRLYRNGKLVASGACGGLLPNPLMKSMAIGCKTDHTGEEIAGYYWNGRIDELALFNNALSAETIRRLYDARPTVARGADPEKHSFQKGDEYLP